MRAVCAAFVLRSGHRLNPKAWPGDGLWFDSVVTEERVLQSWTKIAHKLCSQWNVFAVDLQNECDPSPPLGEPPASPLTHSPLGTAHPMECHSDHHGRPHASSWAKGGGHDVDWGHAAERIGNHVLSVCPRWLIMVEGVGYSPGALGMDSGSAGICTEPPGFERRVALCQLEPVHCTRGAAIEAPALSLTPRCFFARHVRVGRESSWREDATGATEQPVSPGLRAAHLRPISLRPEVLR